jgi:SAM-dependent methyltransferase
MNTDLKRMVKQTPILATVASAARTGLWGARVATSLPRRSRIIRDYLRSHRVRRLQVGAGPNPLEGWLNADIYPRSREVIFLDATRRFPFRDGTFHYVFSEHMIEHLPYGGGAFMLRECYRVLRPGGRIRIATPSLEALVQLATPTKTDLQNRYVRWVIDTYFPGATDYDESFVLSTAYHAFGHLFIYNQATLRAALKNAGFEQITPCAPEESDDPVFKGIEAHTTQILREGGDADMNLLETMVMEGLRPA